MHAQLVEGGGGEEVVDHKGKERKNDHAAKFAAEPHNAHHKQLCMCVCV